ncbi:MAG: GNAT family N-acetyltransferase [Alphaproteobacteria bacterium]|nr:GNAT family N-acetyltransferase [Alphaproteobacteria bacterium]
MKIIFAMIRKYREDDKDVVVSTWRAASELAHPFLENDFLDEEEGNVRNVYLAFAETWVTEIDGEVVGFIALIDNEIGGLFLNPKYHGQGLGKAMVDIAFVEMGSLKVEVFKDNEIGRRFYDAYGFRGDDEFIHEASGQVTLRLVYPPV